MKIKWWSICINNWMYENVNTLEQMNYYQDIYFLLLLHLPFRFVRNYGFMFHPASCFNLLVNIAVKNLLGPHTVS